MPTSLLAPFPIPPFGTSAYLGINKRQLPQGLWVLLMALLTLLALLLLPPPATSTAATNVAGTKTRVSILRIPKTAMHNKSDP
ncbi:hypothetical protein AWZ03_014521 [Drosophila navojoa]|uniref:Uncharacterized protein n=1 Tax=Drosophila navojoa TaxID=7232 RepID=A0A484AQU2_DRONA|nr:hypothetical protein AWZ03_014521 [Drosophila navojoa]